MNVGLYLRVSTDDQQSGLQVYIQQAKDFCERYGHTYTEIFIDEDVPGGATSFMFQQVMEIQGGYRWLDIAPRTLSAKAHRPAYGSDGDYFSKPNAEDVSEVIMEMMKE